MARGWSAWTGSGGRLYRFCRMTLSGGSVAGRREHEVGREPRIRDVREHEVARRQLLLIGMYSEESGLAKGRDRLTGAGGIVPRVIAERRSRAACLNRR